MSYETDYGDLFFELDPVYASEVFPEDWEKLSSAVKKGLDRSSSIKTPKGGEKDPSLVPLEALFVFLEIVHVSLQIVEAWRKRRAERPTANAIEIELKAKLRIPEKTLIKCLEKNILKKICERSLRKGSGSE